jgi:hypothetical protein
MTALFTNCLLRPHGVYQQSKCQIRACDERGADWVREESTCLKNKNPGNIPGLREKKCAKPA